MSEVDVVQRTIAALPSLPSYESAMAAAAAPATAPHVKMSPSTPTPISSVSGSGGGNGIHTTAATTTTPPTSSMSHTPPPVIPTFNNRPLVTTPNSTAAATSSIHHNHHSNPLHAHAHAHPQPQLQSHSLPQSPNTGIKRTRNSDHSRDGRTTKSRQRPLYKKTMEPPVLSFYGTQPVPLPSRFAHLKKRLVANHERELEASWARLLDALRDEIKHIEKHGSELIPSIDYSEIEDPTRVASFGENLKRSGIGVIRGVVPAADADAWVEETKSYLETKHEFKPPPAQDPTCFDFFWTPAQVRSRAHPHVLQAQRFAMSLWNTNDEDRLATRFPITYADRIRIESIANGTLTVNGAAAANASPEDSLIAAAAAAASTASIAQVDNGSLERWELDGYGRCGLYDAIFRGEWESYNEWNPAGRINATSDLYNGAGACSMMRLFQGILALTIVEPGMIRLLPSPKLSTAYFLLRPFFSPKEGPPSAEDGEATVNTEAWEKYLSASNWTMDEEQSTVIHGAVPGHAQRVTAAWHPHLRLDKSLITPPTLQVGDYIIWHPDQPYQFSNTNYRTSSRPHTSSSREEPQPPCTTSMLVYTPAAPLTQTNALFLARQRKAFLRGHPGPDFDSTGTGLGSEAPHTGRLGEKDIRDVGGEEGLQAMGLAPWTLTKPVISPRAVVVAVAAAVPGTPSSSSPPRPPSSAGKDTDTVMISVEDSQLVDGNGNSSNASEKAASSSTSPSAAANGASEVASSLAEQEVVRLANIILFPDRYDFYMPTRASSPVPGAAGGGSSNGSGSSKDGKEKEKDTKA